MGPGGGLIFDADEDGDIDGADWSAAGGLPDCLLGLAEAVDWRGEHECPEKQRVGDCEEGEDLDPNIGAAMLAEVHAPWDFLECDPHAFSVTVTVEAGHCPGTYNGQTIAEIVAEIGDPFFAAALRLADPAGPSEEAVERELSTYLSIEGYEGQVLVDADHVLVGYYGQGPDTQAEREVFEHDHSAWADIEAHGRCADRGEPPGLRSGHWAGVEPFGDAQYVVDALGRRVARKVLDPTGHGELVTHFYYAAGPGSAGYGHNVIVETDGDGTAQRYYVNGARYTRP